eukprot:c5444_g1_i1.p1 GENE.c5444_g1_i1~~c5444_g1_i1.p1  ORF type:complete len:577 (+),score=168.73 c5444_g1_i1:47-1732(+)
MTTMHNPSPSIPSNSPFNTLEENPLRDVSNPNNTDHHKLSNGGDDPRSEIHSLQYRNSFQSFTHHDSSEMNFTALLTRTSTNFGTVCDLQPSFTHGSLASFASVASLPDLDYDGVQATSSTAAIITATAATTITKKPQLQTSMIAVAASQSNLRRRTKRHSSTGDNSGKDTSTQAKAKAEEDKKQQKQQRQQQRASQRQQFGSGVRKTRGRERALEMFESRLDECAVRISAIHAPSMPLTRAFVRGMTLHATVRLNGDVSWLSNKAGGHDFLTLSLIHSNSFFPRFLSNGMLYTHDNRPITSMLLKPLQTKQRGEREVSFFETVAEAHARVQGKCANANEIECDKLLRWIPAYWGVLQVGHVPWLVLENITANFRRPNVLDLKMGERTFMVDAATDKKTSEIIKYHQAGMNFRITGMLLHERRTSSDPVIFDQEYGHKLKPDELPFSFLKFFEPAGSKTADVIRRVREILVELVGEKKRNDNSGGWLGRLENQFSFVGCSLLIVYDVADPMKIDVRLIDFGNTVQGKGEKGNNKIALGIHSVIATLTLAEQTKARPFSQMW